MSSNEFAFTGERLHKGSTLFGVDLARHRAPYVYARGLAGSGRVLDLGCGSGYGTAELADSLQRIVGLDRIPPDSASRRDNASAILEIHHYSRGFRGRTGPRTSGSLSLHA